MMRTNFVRFYTLITVITTFGCSESFEPTEKRMAIDYFPLATGNFWIYDIKNTRYFPDGEIIKEEYKQMDSVLSKSEIGGIDEFTFGNYNLMEDGTWELNKVWTVRYQDGQLVTQKDNLQLVVLSSPVREGNSWDGNYFNTNGNDDFIYEYINDDAPYMGFNPDGGHLKVLQNDNEDLVVNLDKRWEIYGSGIGLIHGSYINFSYCQEESCLGQQVIAEGLEMNVILVDYSIY